MAELLKRLLPADYLLLAYFVSTGAMAAIHGSGVGLSLAAAHLAGVAFVFMVAWLPFPSNGFLVFLRLAYPIAFTPLLYGELATLNQLMFPGYFDANVQVWELALFGEQLSMVASDWYNALWYSEAIHFGYFSYYALVPGGLIAVFAMKGRAALGRASFTVALAFYMCYLCFAVFPVAGPRYEFVGIAGTPSEGAVFQMVHALLEGGSSKGTAFPSSHVAATVSAWLAVGRESRRTFLIMAPFVIALTWGTVYGRFHYGIDAAVGLLFAATAFLMTPWMVRKLGGFDSIERSA